MFLSQEEKQLIEKKEVLPTELKIGDLKKVLLFVLRNRESIGSFMQLEGWELHFPEESVRASKAEFMSQNPTMIERARWRIGLFDSVTTHFVIGKKIADSSFVPGEPSSIPFAITFQRQREMESGVGRTATSDYLAVMGAEIERHAWAWREKMDGTPMETVAGVLRCCFFTMPTIETLAAELTSNGLYQIYPYGPALEVSGIKFHDHPWLPFSETPDIFMEGVILLGKDYKEYRIKRFPSIELENAAPLYNGVWEYEQQGSTLCPIRPRTKRPHKNFAALAKVLSLDEIVWPALDFRVQYVNEGEVRQVVEFSEGVLYIDTCRRPGKIVAYNKDVVTFNSGHATYMYPASIPFSGPVVIGVKLMILCRGQYWVFKDGSKKYDLIGGAIEPGESSESALRREFLEETGYMCPQDVRYIGISQDGKFFSFLYFVCLEELPEVSTYAHFAPFSHDLPMVPWGRRLYVHALLLLEQPTTAVVVGASDILELCPSARTFCNAFRPPDALFRTYLTPKGLNCTEFVDWSRWWAYAPIIISRLYEGPIKYVELLSLNVTFLAKGLRALSYHEVFKVCSFLGSLFSPNLTSRFVDALYCGPSPPPGSISLEDFRTVSGD